MVDVDPDERKTEKSTFVTLPSPLLVHMGPASPKLHFPLAHFAYQQFKTFKKASLHNSKIFPEARNCMLAMQATK